MAHNFSVKKTQLIISTECEEGTMMLFSLTSKQNDVKRGNIPTPVFLTTQKNRTVHLLNPSFSLLLNYKLGSCPFNVTSAVATAGQS